MSIPALRRAAAPFALAACAACVVSPGSPSAGLPGPARADGVGTDATVEAPGLRIRVDEERYPVAGLTPGELNRELAHRGPVHRDRRWHGLTRWELAWSYRPLEESGACRVAGPTVEVRLVTLLPHWRDRARAEPALVHSWERFLTRLEAHEEEHRRIATRAGVRLLGGLRTLAAPSCGVLRDEVARMEALESRRVDAEQLRFDRRTGFGRAEPSGPGR